MFAKHRSGSCGVTTSLRGRRSDYRAGQPPSRASVTTKTTHVIDIRAARTGGGQRLDQIRTRLTGKSRSRSANRRAWGYKPARPLPPPHAPCPPPYQPPSSSAPPRDRNPLLEQAGPLLVVARRARRDATTDYTSALDATALFTTVRRIDQPPTFPSILNTHPRRCQVVVPEVGSHIITPCCATSRSAGAPTLPEDNAGGNFSYTRRLW